MGNISKDELSKMMSELRRRGLSDTDIRDLKNMASGHMDRNAGLGGSKSMSREEAEQMLKNLKDHPSQHHLSKEQVEKVKEEMEEDLRD